MKRSFKKALAIIIVFVMIFVSSQVLWSFDVSAAEYSGVCGDNLTWTLNTDTGELNISGTGDMTDWSSSSYVPWNNTREIKNITIANGVTSIGNYAFEWCECLTSVVIPDTVTRIGDSAFSNCTVLTEITIPNAVTSVGCKAFNGCERLLDIIIPNSVKSIGDYAFWDCKNLANVTIGNSVATIGVGAFKMCYALKNVSIGNSVTHIGKEAFIYCESLTSITIPDSVVYIGDFAFYYCNSLTDVYYTGDIDKWCSINFGRSDSNPMCYAENFYINKTPLPENIIISSSVTNINKYSFYNCSTITSITIPASVISIGDEAFYYCSALTDVYYGGTEEQWKSISINYGNEELTGATIHYKEETQKASLIISNDTAHPGETVKVTVSISDNLGIVSALLKISYDTEKLTLVSVENGEIFANGDFEKGNDLSAMPYTVLWLDATAKEDYTADGKLLTLTFKVADDAPEGNTEISITYDEKSTFNAELQPVSFTVENGTVTIKNRIPGDANGDDELNLKDVVAIRRYLAGGWGIEIDESNADVDGSGDVNLVDAALITRFLADWDVTLV